MSAEDPTVLTLDCRGLYCPLPLVKTRAAMERLAPGEVLRLLATDPGSVADMEAYCRLAGHRLVDRGEVDGEFTFRIRKGDTVPGSG